MKIVDKVFLMIILISNYQYGFAQTKLSSASIKFLTPSHSDDKDWDTRLNVSLYLSDGTLVGKAEYNSCDEHTSSGALSGCFCCVQPVRDNQGHVITPNTMFVDDGSTRGSFTINITNHVSKQSIKTGYFVITMDTGGRDRWVFKPNLVLQFDDGSEVPYVYNSNVVIQQDAPSTTLIFH
jgi:hypothetical protein